MHRVCLTRLTPTGFWRGGAAKREQGESEVIRRHKSFPLQTRGRVTVGAVFFSQCTPRPDLHTPIGWRGARKKGGRRRSTQGNGRQPGGHLAAQALAAGEKSSTQGNDSGRRAGGAGGREAAKPINDNPAAGKTHELLLCSAILSTFTLKIRWEQDWTCILPGNNDVTYPINSGERCGAGLLAG